MPENLPPRSRPLGTGTAAGWWAAAGFAMVAAMSLLAFFGLNQRFRATADEAQVQSTEFDLLTRTLQTESLLADQSLAQLQQALTGQTLSALATLSSDQDDATVTVLWSDEHRIGYLVLPLDLATQFPESRLTLSGASEQAEIHLPLTRSTHARILGLQQTEDAPALQSLSLTLTSLTDPSQTLTLTGPLQR